jgi:predicted  nucleic acid-binding Zn-ribbon protein
MAFDDYSDYTSIHDVGKLLRVENSNSIRCRYNHATHQMQLERMELFLEGTRAIPNGWRGKVRVIDSYQVPLTLDETIVLPVIAPGQLTPIAPIRLVDIPAEVVDRLDEWKVEFYIIDSSNIEARILVTNIQSIVGDEESRNISPTKALEAELEKERELRKRAESDLVDELKKSENAERKIKLYMSRQEEQEKELRQIIAEREAKIRELSEDVMRSNTAFVGLSSMRERLQSERDQFEREKRELQQANREQETRIATLQVEITTKGAQLAQQADDIQNLSRERHRLDDEVQALRARIDGLNAQLEASTLAHNQRAIEEGQIRGLETELERNRAILQQRNQQLDEEKQRSLRLDQELSQAREAVSRFEEELRRQKTTAEQLNREIDGTKTSFVRIRSHSESLEVELANEQSRVDQMKRELADIQARYDSARERAGTLEARLEAALSGQVMDERYELIRKIQWDATIEIYKVYDRKLNRAASLRVLPDVLLTDRRALRQMEADAQLLAKLEHPNTIRLYDFVRDGTIYIVMEFAEGILLRQLLQREGILQVSDALDIVEQICEGLQYAHGKGVIHRNLSPEHLMVTESGFVKIMDFGIANTIRLTISRSTGESSPATIRYLSPEQLLGNPNIDARSDVYSLAVICYELLSGRPPFNGEDTNAILRDPPSPIDFLPTTLNEILQKALSKNPDTRFASIAEFKHAIQALR